MDDLISFNSPLVCDMNTFINKHQKNKCNRHLLDTSFNSSTRFPTPTPSLDIFSSASFNCEPKKISFEIEHETIPCTGRESLLFDNNNMLLFTGRESLEQEMEKKFDTFFAREALSTEIGRESIPFSGRDSLAFEIDKDSNSFSERSTFKFTIPSIKQDHVDMPEQYSDNAMNTGFLCPKSFINRKTSATSSISSNPSIYNSFDFNSLAPSEPSPIFSLNYTNSFKNSDLNHAFHFASNQSEIIPYGGSSFLNHNINQTNEKEDNIKTRICSLPANIIKNNEDDKDNAFLSVSSNLSHTNVLNNRYSTIRSQSSSLSDEEDDVFNDSLYIEAHHLAYKLADGSILDNSLEEGNLLDRTTPPNWNDISDKKVTEFGDTETVFKVVDKMLPPLTIIEKLDPCSSLVNSDTNDCDEQISENSISKNEFLKHLSGIFKGEKKLELSDKQLSVSRTSSTSTVSRDAKDIIHNLSVILNNGQRNYEQKLAGQSLLLNLADILYSDNKSDSLDDDSGHSSIEMEDNPENGKYIYEALDLSCKASAHTYEKEDSSNKASYYKGRSRSFSAGHHPLISNNIKQQTIHKISSNVEHSLASSNEFKNSTESTDRSNLIGSGSNAKMKLKKKMDTFKSQKTGPMKAIIPITVMAKDKNIVKSETVIKKTVDQTTPKRTENNFIYKSKRTSTPIAEPKLKPMAQSTPENGNKKCLTKPAASTILRKRNLQCPISPLTRVGISEMRDDSSVNISNNNKSGSVPNLYGSSKSKTDTTDNKLKPSISRRRSACDVKTLLNSRIQLRRSYSITGKENSLSSKLPAKSVENNTTAVGSKTFNVDSNLKGTIKTNRNSNIKPVKPISRLGRNKPEAKI